MFLRIALWGCGGLDAQVGKLKADPVAQFITDVHRQVGDSCDEVLVVHMSDWNHPSLKGSYLMACVIYSAVFQESTVDKSVSSVPVLFG